MRSNSNIVLVFLGFMIICCLFKMENVVGEENTTRRMLANLNTGQDWRLVHDVDGLKQQEEGISFECTGSDPYIFSSPLNFDSQAFKAIEIEMKVDGGSQGQVFWSNTEPPHFSEPKSARFKLEADGQFHTYVLTLSNQAKWSGQINLLRLDPCDSTANVHLRSFKILSHYGAKVVPLGLFSSVPFSHPGESFQLQAKFKNEGDIEANIKLSLSDYVPAEFKLKQKLSKALTIPPGEEQEASWQLAARNEGLFSIECKWIELSGDNQSNAYQTLSRQLHVYDVKETHKTLKLNTKNGRAVFYLTKFGYGPVCFQYQKGNEWIDMAWMANLGRASFKLDDGNIETFSILTQQAKPNEKDGRLTFTHTLNDQDGRVWKVVQTYRSLDTVAGAIEVVSELELLSNRGNENANGQLVHFSGPELYIGEKSFGQNKDLAVFPGIEYIDQDAVSSSDEVAHPPVRDHYMPHPYKNTIPYMALTHDGVLISMLWPAHAKWSKNGFDLTPKFAVPNRLYGQKNHLMGLFVPSVPNYVNENREQAYEPYVIQSGEKIRLESVIYITASHDPNDALDAWLKVYNNGNYPEPESAPRSYAESIAVSRKAYLTTCWDANANGWGHCAGWAASPSGGMLALLSLDHFLCDDPEVKETLKKRIDRVQNHILKTQGPAGLGSPSGCHVMTFEPAFYWGVAESWLTNWRRRAQGLANGQNPDGSWGFNPTREQQMDLGEKGEVVSGTISPNAMYLMRAARITADPVATKAGLKALDALNARSVPRGAQGWECPIAAGDIMVSGHGTRANLDAYLITGDSSYLKQALYWAKTGVPFHYLWRLDDRPLQMYATIPIFGTTFFSHSWRGVPVQWCGLVYAYALQELANHDQSQPWLKIARGIVNSALHQQLTDGPYAGTLPDSYGDYFITARGAYINPENIMTNLHALEGNSLNIRTLFVESPSKTALRISANADLNELKKEDESIHFNVQSKKDRLTELLITPLEERPETVYINNNAIDEVKSLYSITQGWRYLADYQSLLIHVTHQSEDEDIRIVWGD